MTEQHLPKTNLQERLDTIERIKRSRAADALMRLALSIKEGEIILQGFSHERETVTLQDIPGPPSIVLTGAEHITLDFVRLQQITTEKQQQQEEL